MTLLNRAGLDQQPNKVQFAPAHFPFVEQFFDLLVRATIIASSLGGRHEYP